jgi:23S rRNA (guanosine2251-2'-O)-methyltransferase
MIVYGRNPVREALRGRRAHAVGHMWATRATAREEWLAGHSVAVVDAPEIERVCGSSAHQGVCADAGPYPYVGEEELLSGPEPVVVALDELQDPQNLGAICRSAECAGATGVVITERRSVHVTAAVCKASAGAVEHLPVARVTNLSDFLARAKRAGCWCYGASAGAARTYSEMNFDGGVVLVLGAEGRGLRPRVRESCDEVISVPLRGRVQSLNVAAAAAVVLYGILQGKLPLDRTP